MKNLKSGIFVLEYKQITEEKEIKDISYPEKVILPLSQHTGKPSRLIVKEGDSVKEADLIAECDGLISSNLHSSITGRIKKIKDFPHPTLINSKAIYIEKEEENKKIWEEKSKVDFNKEKLLEIIKEKGIVGLGGAAFPTHVKLSPPKDYKIDTLIINGCECEPFLTCDDVLMKTYPQQIIKGIEIIEKIIEPEKIIIAIEDNKRDAIIRIKELVKDNSKIKIKILKTKYPQGAEKQLIKVLLNREVPPKGLPFHVGVIVQNIATCFAIYEAVYKDKPLIEKVITLSGDCLKNPGNYRVRVGTILKDIIDEIGGFIKEPKKIIFGGPMMGIAQATLDFPILKATSGVLFLSENLIKIEDEYNCIRCARCVDVCPMNLLPTKLASFSKNEKWDLAKEYNIIDCIECGCCQYVCPAKIPLTHLIRLGKKIVIARDKK